MRHADDIPTSDNSNDSDRRIYEALNKPTPHRLLIYKFRQCPDCDAHLFPGTVKHKCEVLYLVQSLKGEDFVRFREDKIKSKGNLFLLFNQDENGYKTYWIEDGSNDFGYEWLSREDFYTMLQN